ncbi:MAG: hypothetical protein A3F40_00440 [Chlamydiae bacterium RIFCSPHIGHO2_12_FULL_27_8]|nr:MAG: hypothetical protein A3F40_00440 [Chlamydiae bacterium RIFCSPHIGHO2_12_FULL_27_8]
MKKFLILIPFFSIFSLFSLNEVNIYFFWGNGCPHCKKEEDFLQKIEKKYSNVKINSYEISRNKENKELLKEIGSKMEMKISSLPITIINDKYFIGFHSDNTTGKAIENVILEGFEKQHNDVVQGIISKKKV